MDILSYVLAKKYTDEKVVEIAGGFHYKGAVNTRANLPTNASIGDIYTVKFKDDGTTVWNAEFVWGKYEGTNQWIELGPDYEAEITALKNSKLDKPIEPVAGQGINVPYYFDVQYNETDAIVKDYTIDLLDKTKAPQQFQMRITAASAQQAGLLQAGDKFKLDTLNQVEANPTLVGEEQELTSIQIGENKFKIPEGGSSYSAGNAIDITNNIISAKYDDNTIKVNADGKLYATAGGQVIDCNSVGMIVPFAGTGTIPTGYLFCDGAAVSRTTYSELFAVIGTTYGPGDGSTTFNIPDLREKFVEGSSASKAVGTSISAGLPNITASVAVRDTDKNDHSLPIIEGAIGSFNITTDGGQHATLKYNGDTNYEHKVLNLDASTSSSVYGNSTTVQPNAVVAKYIIKYTNTLGTLTTVIANPTLAGTEGNLDSIQIGDTKFNSSRIKPFPSDFVTKKTLKEFGQSVVNYAQFKMGSTWYGGIECSDLPGGMMQVECKVTAIRDTTITPYENIAIIEIFSSEVAPFYWTYNTNSWEKGTGLDDWKYVVEIDESKLNSITAAYNEELDVKVKKVHAAAGSTGWEFYVDKPTDISGKVDKPTEPVAGQGVNVPYYFDVNYAADKVTVKDYTIDLLDKSKAPQQFSIDINCATQTNAGLLSAVDKKKIDDSTLPADPTDTEAEYVLATKYVDGVWVKYWKETANKSDLVDKGTVDYMVLKQ